MPRSLVGKLWAKGYAGGKEQARANTKNSGKKGWELEGFVRSGKNLFLGWERPVYIGTSRKRKLRGIKIQKGADSRSGAGEEVTHRAHPCLLF